jgi:hypothetical protein
LKEFKRDRCIHSKREKRKEKREKRKEKREVRVYVRHIWNL